MTKKKKIILVTISSIVLLCIVTGIFLRCKFVEFTKLSQNLTFTNIFTTDEDILAELPLFGDKQPHTICNITNDSTINVIIDTGWNCDFFTLSSSSWDAMLKSGLLSDEGDLSPVIGGDAFQSFSWKNSSIFRTYRLGSILAPRILTCIKNDDDEYEISTSPFWKSEIHGVPITKNADGHNFIGILLMDNFVVEFSKGQHRMWLRKSVPASYTRSIDLKHDDQRFFNTKHRYAMPIKVNDRLNWYLIDTGWGKVSDICLPHSDRKYYEDNPRNKTISQEGIPPTDYDLVRSYISVNGKEYLVNIEYWKDDKRATQYTVNPYAIFNEDFVIDWKNLKMWFKD